MIMLCTMCALAVGSAQAVAAPDGGAPVAPGTLMLVIPRDSLTWKSDGFGQVMGGSVACAPLPGRVKSVQPSTALPDPLRVSESTSSLRISGSTGNGLVRDIAALQWVGPVITWQRLPVPAGPFDQALKALSGWLVANSFDVRLEDGSVVRIGTESQRLSVSLGTGSQASAAVAIAEVPEGLRLVVPEASPLPPGSELGDLGEGPFLVELDSVGSSMRIATHRDTILDIDVSRTPAEVRVSAVTPSRSRLERVLQDIAMTEELMKGAPQDQLDILGPQRTAQQAAANELRRAAAGERVRPTVSPIRAALVDPRTGREYVTLSITVTDATGGDRLAPPKGVGAP
jgi:hypothetical protein